MIGRDCFLEALIPRSSVYNVHYLGKEFSFFGDVNFENNTSLMALKEQDWLLRITPKGAKYILEMTMAMLRNPKK